MDLLSGTVHTRVLTCSQELRGRRRLTYGFALPERRHSDILAMYDYRYYEGGESLTYGYVLWGRDG